MRSKERFSNTRCTFTGTRPEIGVSGEGTGEGVGVAGDGWPAGGEFVAGKVAIAVFAGGGTVAVMSGPSSSPLQATASSTAAARVSAAILCRRAGPWCRLTQTRYQGRALPAICLLASAHAESAGL